MSKIFLTAESVCAGHPDKLCDYISDTILDACLSKDKYSRVACEVMATKGNIFVAGEITSKATIDVKQTVIKALKTIGYDPADFNIHIYLHAQSQDIAHGVDNPLETREKTIQNNDLLGAGDQGTVYGYAIDENEALIPLPLLLSHKLCEELDNARKNGDIQGIKPDGKAQVSVIYNNDKPHSVKTVVLSIQHDPNKNLDKLRTEIINKIFPKVFKDFPLNEKTEIFINPAGKFIEGGPVADTGLTGRKLMVDTYGGLGPHGGGAFSGKDATKVDRSAAYMARHIAKIIVASNIAKKCQVSISYAIGKANPVAINVQTYATSTLEPEIISKAVEKTFDLRPTAIIEYLDLLKPIYAKTATYGHFTNANFSWERIDQSIIDKFLINCK